MTRAAVRFSCFLPRVVLANAPGEGHHQGWGVPPRPRVYPRLSRGEVRSAACCGHKQGTMARTLGAIKGAKERSVMMQRYHLRPLLQIPFNFFASEASQFKPVPPWGFSFEVGATRRGVLALATGAR